MLSAPLASQLWSANSHLLVISHVIMICDPTSKGFTSITCASYIERVCLSLQDVADSRRINTNIREEESRLPVEEQATLPLSAMIISSEFWPQLKEEKMELPAVASKAMEDYTHRFEKLKVLQSRVSQPVLF